MRRGSVVIVVGASLWAAADRRLAAARARSAAADVLVTMAVAPEAVAIDLDAVAFVPTAAPGPCRALGAWVLSWPVDVLSRIKLGLARPAVRASAPARARPAARPRVGP